MAEQTVQTVTRLREDVYKQLESQCPKPVINQQTTDLMAAYYTGAAFVLEKLRTGFVIKDT